jgi:hypothetical protein
MEFKECLLKQIEDMNCTISSLKRACSTTEAGRLSSLACYHPACLLKRTRGPVFPIFVPVR